MKIMRNKFIQTSIWFAFTAIIAAFPATATDTDRFSRVIENCEKRHGCIISMLAVNMRGDTIAQRNSTYSMIPASVTKTVTTALALKELGPNFRFETSIAYSGHIDSTGILHGDIYIVGGADPTLASTLPRQVSVFNIWHRAVKAAGIDSIAGSVIGDDRFFPDEAAAGSWELGDLGTYYGSGASGLSFHENYISLRITPSEHPEGRPDIEQLFPRTPWMEIENLAVTGRRKSGNSLYMLASEIEPVSQLRGSYPINGGTSIEKCSTLPGGRWGRAFFAVHVFKLVHKKSPGRFRSFPAVRTGLEPATPGVTGRYSNQTELPHQYPFLFRVAKI